MCVHAIAISVASENLDMRRITDKARARSGLGYANDIGSLVGRASARRGADVGLKPDLQQKRLAESEYLRGETPLTQSLDLIRCGNSRQRCAATPPPAP